MFFLACVYAVVSISEAAGAPRNEPPSCYRNPLLTLLRAHCEKEELCQSVRAGHGPEVLIEKGHQEDTTAD